MKTHSCMNDKVLLTFESVPRATSANTTQNLQTIRDSVESWGRALEVFSYPEVGTCLPRISSNRSGVIVVAYRYDVLRIQVAQELTRYPAAIPMILRHERAHAVAWEDAALLLFQRWGQLLAGQIRGTPNLPAVWDALRGLRPRLPECLNNSEKSWDHEDWPSLHHALLRVGVPLDLVQSSALQFEELSS